MCFRVVKLAGAWAVRSQHSSSRATCGAAIGMANMMFRSPPREGATTRAQHAKGRDHVSIHAPVKGRHSSNNGAVRDMWFRSTPP